MYASVPCAANCDAVKFRYADACGMTPDLASAQLSAAASADAAVDATACRLRAWRG